MIQEENGGSSSGRVKLSRHAHVKNKAQHYQEAKRTPGGPALVAFVVVWCGPWFSRLYPSSSIAWTPLSGDFLPPRDLLGIVIFCACCACTQSHVCF